MAKETKAIAKVTNDDSFFDEIFGKQLETQDTKFSMNPAIKATNSGKFEIAGKGDKAEIEVIILSNIIGNEYRNAKTNPDRPDCSSVGGENGNRFGKCAKCPYNVWHDLENGKRGKACVTHDKLAVLFAKEDDATMYELRVTKASRTNLTDYFKSLTKNRQGLSSQITRLSIEVVKESGGIKYPKVQFKAIEATKEVNAEHPEYNIKGRMMEALEKLPLFFKLTPECENPDTPGNELKDAKPNKITVTEEEATVIDAPKVAEVVQAADDEVVPF